MTALRIRGSWRGNISGKEAIPASGKICRSEAIAVEDDRREAKQFLLDAHPELKGMYSTDSNNTQVLYLKNAVARFHSFSNGEPKVVEF
jgi:uncharacterized pyridoxamine 5'-phosphate oxidase family protein